jgi:hypothetical protein
MRNRKTMYANSQDKAKKAAFAAKDGGLAAYTA